MKRAVITGLGIISSIGNNKKEVLNSLKKCNSGISFSQEFKDSGMRSHVWGNIKIDINKNNINKKIKRFMNDASIYAYISMEQAIKDSGLSSKMVSNERTGIVIGSGGGSPKNQIISYKGMLKKGLYGIGPYMVTKIMTSGISACLATQFKIRGINYSINSACSTSTHCIGHALELIQLGKQDIIFAGGGEELSWEMACEFDAMGVLSRKWNNFPKKSSRTYDIKRDGFVISGGGGIVVIEELIHALTRNANIYGEIIGYGANSDGFNIVKPSGEGAVRCMKMAMSSIDISMVDYINVHGTSTIIGDIIELNAIREIFGNKPPALSSTKSMTGHSLGVAGVHEVIYTLLMLENNFIAASINIDFLDPLAKNMNIITNIKNNIKLNIVMTNNFGFGGTNASLLIRKY